MSQFDPTARFVDPAGAFTPIEFTVWLFGRRGWLRYDPTGEHLRCQLAIHLPSFYVVRVDLSSTVDGRHARRERSRRAVIEAAFALIQEGKLPPSLDDVAERSGVSASSIFRNFDGIADVQRQALDAFHPRFVHLFVVEDAGSPRSERVRSHVRARVELASVAGGLIMIARSRALDHEAMVEGVARLRGRLADQTRQRFASELDELTPTETASLVALIDSITSPEAFELMSASHARSPRQIASSWVKALDVMLDQWAPTADEDQKRRKETSRS